MIGQLQEAIEGTYQNFFISMISGLITTHRKLDAFKSKWGSVKIIWRHFLKKLL